MNINGAVFEAAFGLKSQLPESDLPEVCFSGRSNVGKSSLINKVLGRKSLARVSATPGKTVTVNFYKADSLRLVDLPGYGYAKIIDAEKQRFAELLEHYFASGRNIKLCLQLVDGRRAPTAQDIQMIEYMVHYNLPFCVVMTKCDKLNKTEFAKSLAETEKILSRYGDIKIIPFSALKNMGVEDVRSVIEQAI